MKRTKHLSMILLAILLVTSMTLTVFASPISETEIKHRVVSEEPAAQKDYTTTIIIVACAAVLAAAAGVVIWKFKKTPEAPVSAPIQPAAPPMVKQAQPYIKFESGPLQGKVFPISSKGMSIGRDSSCDIAFPGDTRGVSRKHCRVYTAGSAIMIEDLGSSNGTTVKSAGTLTPHVPISLQPEELVFLGGEANSFKIKIK